MEIGNIMELGMGMANNVKSAQPSSKRGADTENVFAQDMQRAAQRADKCHEPKNSPKSDAGQKPETAASPDEPQSPKAEDIANEESKAAEDQVTDEGGVSNEEETDPETMALAMAPMMAIVQPQQQPEAISEDEGIIPETELAGIGTVPVTQEQENIVQTADVAVDEDETSDVLNGNAQESAPNTDEATTKQDAKLVEQVLDEIKQAVASNEAERTVSAEPVETHEQEVQAVDTESEYDQDINTDTQAKTRKADMPHEAEKSDIMPEQAMPQMKPEAPVPEVAFKDGQIAPREVQQVFFESVLDQVQTAVTENQTELYVRLKPEVLGGLAIRLMMTEQGLSAQVRTTDQQLETLVRAELSQLEQNLKQRGIDVVDMEVIYDQSANNQYLNQQQQRQWGGDGSGRQGSSRNTVRVVEEAAMLRPYEQMYESMVPTEGIAEESVEYSA